MDVKPVYLGPVKSHLFLCSCFGLLLSACGGGSGGGNGQVMSDSLRYEGISTKASITAQNAEALVLPPLSALKNEGDFAGGRFDLGKCVADQTASVDLIEDDRNSGEFQFNVLLNRCTLDGSTYSGDYAAQGVRDKDGYVKQGTISFSMVIIGSSVANTSGQQSYSWQARSDCPSGLCTYYMSTTISDVIFKLKNGLMVQFDSLSLSDSGGSEVLWRQVFDGSIGSDLASNYDSSVIKREISGGVCASLHGCVDVTGEVTGNNQGHLYSNGADNSSAQVTITQTESTVVITDSTGGSSSLPLMTAGVKANFHSN